ncbi:MAG: tRNA (adenosine(37)-N6)-threonylcarbamoyltransferase complex ATPase subunit type 1 TsaE [Bacteroidetes bacterium]|nr:tRNA (adenosine(37)-N6)-threonylcarbamoyltransferase complex ATPase subunit type 1 TsaE [Bacteroidota bacterium]MBR3091324.1 tRNA (adenosine(37)-N6)-threonylcarbamoyltransferase complex ATPase subunit type 1 TsaE [Bacteroidota bacterium]
MNNIYISKSLEDTQKIAVDFAKQINSGDTILFYGDLGVGKTEFIKSICSFFNVQQVVASPTFTIVNQYEGEKDGMPFNFFHIDLYRIKNQEELINLGFEDYLYSSEFVKLIEWSENSFNLISKYDYSIEITADDNEECTRHIKISKNI